MAIPSPRSDERAEAVAPPKHQPAFAHRGLGLPLAGPSLSWRIFVSRSITSEVSVLSPVRNLSSGSRSVPARSAKSSRRILLACPLLGRGKEINHGSWAAFGRQRLPPKPCRKPPKEG